MKPLEPAVDAPLPPLAEIWHPSAPLEVRQAHQSSHGADGWGPWTRHLANRQQPAALANLLGGKTPPLGWALPGDLEAAFVHKLLDLTSLAAPTGRRGETRWGTSLLVWLGLHLQRPVYGLQFALEALTWAHALPALARVTSAKTWWLLEDYLQHVAAAAASLVPGGDPLVRQLLAGELPLTLAYLFPEIAPCRALGAPAREVLSAGLVDLLDEGLPHAGHWPLLRPLLACWTRCRAMGGQLPDGPWSGAAQDQYAWLVRQAMRLARPDGTQVFSQGPAGTWCPDLFEAAIRFTGDEDDQDIAAVALPRRGKAPARKVIEIGLPDAADHSEWAAAAVLRPGWPRNGPQLTVTYAGGSVRTELRSGRDVLWSGDWGLEFRRDGQALPSPSEWEEICWVSDESADYLELGGQIDEGLRIERHLLLAREDGFLFLADALVSDRPGRFEYRGVLPLTAAAGFEAAEESREGFLSVTAGKGRCALVLPLALPEWRTDPQPGSLERTDQGLELRQSAQGAALFAPLWLDLEPKRFARRFTWRQLTVAESLRAVSSDVAVGYRVMSGNEQWLLYRSLGPRGNRTLLGHNLVSELLVARFDQGEVEGLVEIEGTEDV